jgi:hypothetical protein
MPTAETLRRVPWTCRWGQFGGPVTDGCLGHPGFVFWTCERHAGEGLPRPLGRDECERCPLWEGIPWEPPRRDQ